MAIPKPIRSITCPNPLPHQIPVLLDESRFKLLVCGRRWGKTALGLMAALRGHGPRKGYWRGAANGGKILWVAPNYPEIENSGIWEDLKKACKSGWISKKESPARVITLPSGGKITVVCANEGIRGGGFDGCIIDEAAKVDETVWHEVIRPTLVDNEGWGLFQTTPKGLNWIYRLYRKIQRGESDNWAAWRRPSSENPIIPEGELEQAKNDMSPRAYAQEHDAQFMEVEGAMWPAAYFDEDNIWAKPNEWPTTFTKVAIALDASLGRKHGDYQAAVSVGLADGTFWVDSDIDRRPIGEMISMFDDFARSVRADVVGVEANAFQELLFPLFNQHAEKRGLPPLPIVLLHHHGGSPKSKETRINRLDPYLKNKQIKLRRTRSNSLLLDQLIMHPVGDHDDGPDALEMSVRCLFSAMVGSHQAESVLQP